MSALLDAIKASHLALLSPPATVDAAHIYNAAVCSATAFAICGLVHFFIARRFKRQYFALHVFANAVITALVLPASLRALLHPTNSTVVTPGHQPNVLYMCWIYALHIYHPCFFKTGVMDWVHHVPVYIINTLSFSIPAGDVIGLQSLIMTGIPGGLDYLLQVLEGEGRLSRARYKELCAAINTWLRAPLGAVSAYICFAGLYHGWDATTAWQRFVFSLLALHAVWNPPFFGRQAVEANVVDTINRHGLASAELKLPKVRALAGKPAAAATAAPYPVGAAATAAAASPSKDAKKAK